jgi:hypothetical protein
MNYYRYTLKAFPTLESLDRMPQELGDFLAQQSEVLAIKQISRSTYYRIKRQDAQAFWNNFERRAFAEAAE